MATPRLIAVGYLISLVISALLVALFFETPYKLLFSIVFTLVVMYGAHLYFHYHLRLRKNEKKSYSIMREFPYKARWIAFLALQALKMLVSFSVLFKFFPLELPSSLFAAVFIFFVIDFYDSGFVFEVRKTWKHKLLDSIVDFIAVGILFIVSMQIYGYMRNFVTFWFLNYFVITLISFKFPEMITLKAPNLVILFLTLINIFGFPYQPFLLVAMTINPIIIEGAIHLVNSNSWKYFKTQNGRFIWYMFSSLIMTFCGIFLFSITSLSTILLSLFLSALTLRFYTWDYLKPKM